MRIEKVHRILEPATPLGHRLRIRRGLPDAREIQRDAFNTGSAPTRIASIDDINKPVFLPSLERLAENHERP